MRKFWKVLRELLFSQVNKEFLLFLFFLALSGVFWLFMTLNETYEKEFSIPVTITNIPQNVVLTSDETDTLRVTIRDKGITLATYMYVDGLKNIMLNFSSHASYGSPQLVFIPTGIYTFLKLVQLAKQPERSL